MSLGPCNKNKNYFSIDTYLHSLYETHSPQHAYSLPPSIKRTALKRKHRLGCQGLRVLPRHSGNNGTTYLLSPRLGGYGRTPSHHVWHSCRTKASGFHCRLLTCLCTIHQRGASEHITDTRQHQPASPLRPAAPSPNHSVNCNVTSRQAIVQFIRANGTPPALQRIYCWSRDARM